MTTSDFKGLICAILCSWLNGLATGYEKNCDYLDTGAKNSINYLQCHENGCCGEFTDRYCCRGPIVTVLIIFGVIVGTLILVVTVGVCYSKFREKHMNQVRPSTGMPSIMTVGTLILVVTVGVCYSKFREKHMNQVRPSTGMPSIMTDSYNDIPLPSPVRAPPVYNTARLHRPTSLTPSGPSYTSTPGPSYTSTPQPFKTLRSLDNNREIHPPPSNLHPPRLHLLK